jgi:hypothetical protein
VARRRPRVRLPVWIEFRVRDVFDALDLDVAADVGGQIRLDQTVPLGDDNYLLYGTASGDTDELVDLLVETLPHWRELSWSDDRRDGFELRLVDPPILTTVASVGGTVDTAVVEDDDYRLSVHLSPGVNVRQLTDTVQDVYPGAELVTRRQITRSEDRDNRIRSTFVEDLTDRQRAALESAFYAGFFEWPRKNSGEDVAESLGISSPTFHQHVRAAERKVFESLLSTDLTESR